MSALFPGPHLVVGCEDDPDDEDAVRLYLDTRYLQRFVVVAPEHAAEVRRAWETSSMSHLWARLEPDEPVFQEPPPPH